MRTEAAHTGANDAKYRGACPRPSLPLSMPAQGMTAPPVQQLLRKLFEGCWFLTGHIGGKPSPQRGVVILPGPERPKPCTPSNT